MCVYTQHCISAISLGGILLFMTGSIVINTIVNLIKTGAVKSVIALAFIVF